MSAKGEREHTAQPYLRLHLSKDKNNKAHREARMIRRIGFALASSAWLLCAATAEAGPAEEKLMACMRANIPATLRIQEFQLTSSDRKGEQRKMAGRLFAKNEKDLLRAMLKLTSPADLSGASYLIREGQKADEMYVFLPALNRVRRINGSAGDGPLFGTDLSYADIKQVQNAFMGAAPRIEGKEKLESRPATVVSVVPTAESGSRYSRIKAWVDDASCLAVKVEFMEGTTIRKRLAAPASAIAKAGNYWYVSESTMFDLKLGTKTQLKITGVKSGEDVANRYFDSRNFYLGN